MPKAKPKPSKAKPSKAKLTPKAKAAVKGKAKPERKPKAVSKTATKTKGRGQIKSNATGSRTKKAAPPRRRTEIQDQPFAGETVLIPDDAQPMLSSGTGAAWDFVPDPEVTAIMAEEQSEESGGAQLAEELSEYTSTSPILSGGDVDADWEGANEGGEETVGGDAPTPDQDRVDELGEAAGLTFQDEEPLDSRKKLEKRDTNRWELDPASAHRPK